MTEKRKRLRNINRDIEVVVQSNIYASFSYSDKGVHLELAEIGDEEYLTFGQLKTLSTSKSKRILQNLNILITDVLDDEVELEDVLEQLRLKKNYDSAKRILDTDVVDNESFVRYLKNSNTTSVDIRKVFDEHPFMKTILTETAIEMYKKGSIDIGLVEAILSHIGVKDVYSFLEDIRLSQEPIKNN